MTTMSVSNQVLTDFSLNKEKSRVEIVPGNEPYILMKVEDMSMTFDMDFGIRSKPEWLRDDGKLQVKVTDFDAGLHLIPFNSEGKIQFDFRDAVIDIVDFEVKFYGNSDISEGFELIVNKFKSFFKNELVNIIARKLTKSVEESINDFLFDDQVVREIGQGTGIFQNFTMVGDPILKEDYLAIPFDGTFFVEGHNFTFKQPDMPIHLPQGKKIQVFMSE